MIFSEKFVKATEDFCTLDHFVPAPCFRKSFFATKNKKYELTLCGLGIYILYVNGQNITRGYLASYRSNPDHYLYYDNYDITPYLVEGENVIGITLGNGFNSSEAVQWNFRNIPWRDAPKMAVAVEEDGTLLFEADEFVCAEGAVLFNDYHYGEVYDANKEIKGWTEINCDAQFRPVLSAFMPKGEKRLCSVEPIGIIDVHKPVRIMKTPSGAFVYDFVNNVSGFCELRIKGSKGQEVSVTYGEVLVDGELDLQNVGFDDSPYDFIHKTRFTLKGEGEEKYTPSFSYYSGRFVEVRGISEEQATKDLLTFYEISSSFARTGEFFCDNADINALFDATINSDRANFIFFPTDCPHREKNGWTGDIALSCDQYMLLFDCAHSLKEWMRNIYKAQDEMGRLPGIIPTHDWGYSGCNGPNWDFAMFEIPYRIYKYTGDTEIIEEGVENFMRYLRYMDSKRMSNGLLSYGLGDWCPPGDSCNPQVTARDHTDTITCKVMCERAEEMFRAVGKTEEADYAKKLGEEIREAYRKVYIPQSGRDSDKAKNRFNFSQTPQCMSLYYGMFNEDERELATKHLVRMVKAQDYHANTGVLGGRALYRALAENGEVEVALKTMLNTTFPSYKYNLDMGLTSLAEMFIHSETRVDNKDPLARLWSLNHHFWGDIAGFFISCLAGICIKNCNTVEVKPCFNSYMNTVRASVVTNEGRVSVEYKKTDIKVEMKVVVPKGVTATVVAPSGYEIVYGEKFKVGENKVTFCKKSLS